MQNMDYFNGFSQVPFNPPQYSPNDPEYFSRMANIHQKENARKQKRANRLMTLIVALCIISFTVGLVVGIKFAGNSDKELVDAQTKKTMEDIGTKMTNIISDKVQQPTGEAVAVEKNDVKNSIDAVPKETVDNSESTQAKLLYPKEEFPFVIRIGDKYTARQSKDIADFLSKKGHTVIISKVENSYRIYTGPFKTEEDAKNSLQKLNSYTDNQWYKSSVVLKR